VIAGDLRELDMGVLVLSVWVLILKLKDDPSIFSGLFWSGKEAQALGLVDGLGSSGYVAREVIGAEEIVDYTPKDDWIKRVSERFGAGMMTGLGNALPLTAAPTLR